MSDNELENVNNKLKKLKKAEYAREWRVKNKERKKQENKIWNEKFRNEYQKKYYHAKLKKSLTL